MEVIAVASLQKCRLQNSRESGAEISAAVALAAAAPVLAVLFTIVIDVVALVVIVVVLLLLCTHNAIFCLALL